MGENGLYQGHVFYGTFIVEGMSMSDSFHIRKATREEVPAIIAMLADDPLGSKRENYADPLPEVYYEAYERINADPNQELMVVMDGEEVIGTFQMTYIPYLSYQGGIRAQIETVRIHASRRGQGLGEKVFRWAIERAKQKGTHLIQLTSDKKRPDAIRFYEKLGFVATHEGFKLHFTK